MKVIVLGALPSSLLNFRGALLQRLTDYGNDVIAVASGATKEEISILELKGIKYIDCPIDRNGLNPVLDIKTFFRLIHIFRKEKPDMVFAYTIKPVIWGGIAARFCNINGYYALITGLGFAFQDGSVKRNILTELVKKLYSFALRSAKGVVFQNTDNLNVFLKNKLVDSAKCHIVNGSGVDLTYYNQKPLSFKPRFLLIARLLVEKGIREYAKAAVIVKKRYPDAIFELLGPEDPSQDAISLVEVLSWVDEGIILYSGSTNDVRPYLELCNIFVLPSYHEGMPRTVLEAMAIGRPILTTDVPGCRETVVNGENGFLVEKQNVNQLVEKMIWFIEHKDQWVNMSDKSRALAVNRFDVHKVNDDLLNIMGLRNERNL